VREEVAEALTEQHGGGGEGGIAAAGEGKRAAAPIEPVQSALDEAGPLEVRDELGDGGMRDPGAARELRAADVAGGDRPQREELGHRQRRLAARQQPLDPPGRERCDGGKRVGGGCG
jgi:hypothetical protein